MVMVMVMTMMREGIQLVADWLRFLMMTLSKSEPLTFHHLRCQQSWDQQKQQ